MTLNLSASPHVRDRWTTSFIMHTVLLSLVPAALVGVIVYGWNALLVILASILAAVGTEALFCLACKKPLSIFDGSAAVTGIASAAWARTSSTRPSPAAASCSLASARS